MNSPKSHTGYLNETFFEIFKGNSNSNSVVLFLHGYPSDLGDKNSDLAIELNQKTNLDCFVIHYPGLGKSHAEFSFSKSLKAVHEFCGHLRNIGYDEMHFVGHSWGGFLTLNSTEFWSYKSKVILMSPYLFYEQGNDLKELVGSIYRNTNEYLLPMTELDVLNEMISLSKTCSFDRMVEKVKRTSSQVTIIQAMNDEETSPEIAMKFVKNVGSDKIKYLESETDHAFFTNRATLIDLIIQKGLS